jgi:hypothetical protein
MTHLNILSSVGLILDIIGAIFIMKYGIPIKIIEIKEQDHNVIGWPKAETKEEKDKREKQNIGIKIRAKIGFYLILSGFILQLIGTNLF